METHHHMTANGIKRFSALFLYLVIPFLAIDALAEDELPIYSGGRSNLTFAAKPYDYTKNYLIYEVGFKAQISGSQAGFGDDNYKLSLDLGIMHNLNERYAVGASFHGSTASRAEYLAFRPRVRRWLDKSRGADFSVGVIIANGNYSGVLTSASIDLFRTLSFELMLEKLTFKNVYSFNQSETYQLSTDRPVSSLYFGVSGKDYGAIVGTGAVMVGLIIALASWDFGGSGWGS